MDWTGFDDFRMNAELDRILFHLHFIVLPSFLLSLILASHRTVLPRRTHYVLLSTYLGYLLYSISTHTSQYRTGYVWIDYSMGSGLGFCVFNALHMLVFVDPLKEFRYKNDDSRVGPSGLEWPKRVYWVWRAVVSLRGIGWNYQAPGLSMPRYCTKLKFCVYALQNLFFNLLLADLVQIILQEAPFLRNFNSELHGANDSIGSLPYLQRVVCVATWFLGGYAGIRFYYFTVALVCVGLGVSDPQNWPEAFGSWKEAYSVRNFWGKTWHQFIRRFCVYPGRKLAEMIGVAPKSLIAASIQIYVAFFVSALMHSLGDYMVGRDYVGISFRFFCLQPFAITFEELVKITALRLGLKNKLSKPSTLPARGSTSANASATVKRVVGYMWVVWWFTTTAPFLIDPAMQAGFHRELIFPRSPIRSVVNVLFSE
ncbi:MAG: membrane bound O-acyl transferase family-domain-containing protein [Lentinula lateritia]|nr:MAG: membrane bound O-acyl transferase family-domain-containing protein [Lentinula lateritia]